MITYDQREQEVHGNQYNAGGDLIINEADTAHDVRGLANPYLGLAAFTYAERANYAGRDRQIAQTIAKLVTPGEQRVLLFVTGASGSGKSSFAQAGLIPALEQYYQQRQQIIRRAVFRPSKQPMAMLADALLQLGMPAVPLDAPPASVYQHIQAHTPAQTINLMVIDQFEELFTQSDPAQRDRLFALLSSPPPFSEVRTHLIATVRADYLPELFTHRGLYTQVKDGIELRAMIPEELKQAIQRPLQQHPATMGKYFEEALLERLASDAAADATYLPLLQVTLESLWAKGSLKLQAYGSLTDAIRQRAEEVYGTILDGTPRTPAEQQALLQTFLDLVEVSLDNDARRDVRRRRTLAELTQERPGWEQTIDELATARLLSKGLEQRAGREIEVVDIVHESLIGNWARLREAIASQRDLLQRRVRFELALKEWQAHDQRDAYLLSGVRLVEAETLDQQRDVALRDPAAQELLKRSIARRDSERRQQLRRVQIFAAVLGGLLLLALGAAWFAVDRQQAAEVETERAEQQLAIASSRQLAAQANILANDAKYDTALLLGAQAMAITSTLEAQDSLLTILQTDIIAYLHSHSRNVDSVVFSPDGQILASGSLDGTITLWDVATAQPRARLEGHTASVLSVAFSPDGQTLASSSGDRTIILWDVARAQPRATLEGHTNDVSTVAFSPDGQTLASGSEDTTIILWDLATGQPRTTMASHTSFISSVAFSPDGQTLASGSGDNTIILWEVATGQPRATLKGHTLNVTSVAFSPDGQTLASGSWDGTIILWEVATGQQQAKFVGHRFFVTSVAFSPDGQTLASGSWDYTIILWDVATGQWRHPLEGHSGRVSSVAFSPDGQTLASGSTDNTIILWDVTTGQRHPPLQGHTDSVTSAAFSPDGKLVASGSDDGTIILWDVTTGQQRATLAGNTSRVLSVAFSPDAQNLAAGKGDGTIILWELATRQPRTTLKGHTKDVSSVTFSPDGQTLASGSGDRTIILWDMATGQRRATLEGPRGRINSVAFSPDGQTLASGSWDDTIILWEVATGQPRVMLKGHTSAVTSVAFSPDGQTLASGSWDDTVILWEVATGQQQAQLEGHLLSVTSVAFSPNSQLVASGSWDGTIILWEVATGQRRPALVGHSGWLRSVAFSPDGQTLASSSGDRTIILWDVLAWQNPQLLQESACQVANRNLTWEEWQLYLPGRPYAKTCPNLPAHPSAVAAGFSE